MQFKDLFDRFDTKGALCLPVRTVHFNDIPWSPHAAFEGVALKHLVTAEQTGGRFSFHLVRIAPGCKIGTHVHTGQLETHETIAGSGTCCTKGVTLDYEPGVIAILPMGQEHEVLAGADGLYLFAKFIPALPG